jgi:hypothetical protein
MNKVLVTLLLVLFGCLHGYCQQPIQYQQQNVPSRQFQMYPPQNNQQYQQPVVQQYSQPNAQQNQQPLQQQQQQQQQYQQYPQQYPNQNYQLKFQPQQQQPLNFQQPQQRELLNNPCTTCEAFYYNIDCKLSNQIQSTIFKLEIHAKTEVPASIGSRMTWLAIDACAWDPGQAYRANKVSLFSLF